MRNDILHREDSAGAKMASKHLTEELLDFKYNATRYLRHGDRGQIDHPDAEIMRWTNTRKEGLLKMLRGWRRQYQMEVTLDTKKQCALTKFGFTAERLDRGTGQGNVTRTGRPRRARRNMRGRMRTPNRGMFGAVT